MMLYLIKGEEPLLIEEAIAQILFTEKSTAKRVWEIADNKTFQQAIAELRMPDLFEKNPISIFKMTPKTYKALEKHLKQLPQNTKIISLSPITLKQFPLWIEKQFQQAGFKLLPEAKDLLCTYLEGNIFAAKQCIEKLKLLDLQEKTLSEKQLVEFLIPSARYTLFDFIHTITQAQFSKISIILKKLIEEGVEPPLILWGLARECRKQQKGKLLTILIEVDEMIKGIRPGNIFDALERAAFAMAGKTLI